MRIKSFRPAKGSGAVSTPASVAGRGDSPLLMASWRTAQPPANPEDNSAAKASPSWQNQGLSPNRLPAGNRHGDRALDPRRPGLPRAGTLELGAQDRGRHESRAGADSVRSVVASFHGCTTRFRKTPTRTPRWLPQRSSWWRARESNSDSGSVMAHATHRGDQNRGFEGHIQGRYDSHDGVKCEPGAEGDKLQQFSKWIRKRESTASPDLRLPSAPRLLPALRDQAPNPAQEKEPPPGSLVPDCRTLRKPHFPIIQDLNRGHQIQVMDAGRKWRGKGFDVMEPLPSRTPPQMDLPLKGKTEARPCEPVVEERPAMVAPKAPKPRYWETWDDGSQSSARIKSTDLIETRKSLTEVHRSALGRMDQEEIGCCADQDARSWLSWLLNSLSQPPRDQDLPPFDETTPWEWTGGPNTRGASLEMPALSVTHARGPSGEKA